MFYSGFVCFIILTNVPGLYVLLYMRCKRRAGTRYGAKRSRIPRPELLVLATAQSSSFNPPRHHRRRCHQARARSTQTPRQSFAFHADPRRTRGRAALSMHISASPTISYVEPLSNPVGRIPALAAEASLETKTAAVVSPAVAISALAAGLRPVGA